ncbi:putative lipoprotein YbbD precursor [compost metagenome]
MDLPVITHSEERIRKVELPPFQKAIETGVDCIMSSHIYFPAFEKEQLPATLSHSVLTGLLREELGYEGIIMTDCMEMHAISKRYGTVDAAVMAVQAGADIVLISHTFELQVEAMEALIKATREGRISEEQIDQSVRRILKLKARRGLITEAGTSDVAAVSAVSHEQLPQLDWTQILATPEHLEAAQRLSDANITLVKDTAGLLPLRKQPTLVLSMEVTALTIADESYEGLATLGKALSAQGVEVQERLIPLSQLAEKSEELQALAASYEQIIIGTYNANFYPDQIKLVQNLLDSGKQLIVVALRNPYDLAVFPDVPAYICLYESRPNMIESAAKLLVGQLKAQGKLPVTINSSYSAGSGVVQA